MSRILCSAFLMTAVGTLLMFAGCGEGTTGEKQTGSDKSHPDHAETLEGAMKELAGFKTAIQKAFEDKKPGSAHDALHEVGHVLEELPELAKKEEMSEENIKTLKDAVDVLFDGFGELDKSMHGKTGKSYEEVAKSLDDAMTTLNGLMSGDDSEGSDDKSGSDEKGSSDKKE